MKAPGMKANYNELRLLLDISPEGPVMVKAADSLDPTRPEMEFVRLLTPDGPTVYLPGSSLKGVVRSCAERLLRTLNLACCNPLERSGDDRCCTAAYGGYRNYRKDTEHDPSPCEWPAPAHLSAFEIVKARYANRPYPDKLPYFGHCYACRTFGSTDLASRMLFADAVPWQETDDSAKRASLIDKTNSLLQARPGIAIDRKKGSVKGGALFELEVLAGSVFHTSIVLRNYQLWQLALLLLVVEEINADRQRLGFGKTKQGRARVKLAGASIRQSGWLPHDRLAGIGAIDDDDFREEYDLTGEDSLATETQPTDDVLRGHCFDIKTEADLKALQESLLAGVAFKALLQLGVQDARP